MKNRKLSVLLVLIVFSVAVIGGAYAYFTDSVSTSAGFTAAKVDISKLPANKTFSIGNMAPGVWSAPERLDIYNSGSTIPVKYRLSAAANSESVGGFSDKIIVRVRHTYAGTANEGSWPIVYQGKLKDLVVDSTATAGIISSSLGVNITHCFVWEFKVDESAGNIYQNANAQFTVNFDAAQTNNPGWGQ